MGKGQYPRVSQGAAEGWGRAIRTARAWAGVTQEELAQRVGVRQETVSGWETGVQSPQIQKIGLIGSACGVSTAVLVRWAEGNP